MNKADHEWLLVMRSEKIPRCNTLENFFFDLNAIESSIVEIDHTDGEESMASESEPGEDIDLITSKVVTKLSHSTNELASEIPDSQVHENWRQS